MDIGKLNYPEPISARDKVNLGFVLENFILSWAALAA
jgi:hypothetical protein